MHCTINAALSIHMYSNMVDIGPTVNLLNETLKVGVGKVFSLQMVFHCTM